VGGLCAIAVIYLYVIPYQRELTLVAISDVKFYDGAEQTKIVFELPAGSSAAIAQCRNRNGVIEPAIQRGDGRTVYLVSGRFRIDKKRTGLLTRPRYLGCPGY
jgi:hypothetical protein